MRGFIDFIREKGVVGLAVGFILGGAIQKLVTSMVTDLINPFLGLILGSAKGLQTAYIPIGSAKILYGSFISSFIDFIIIALVVYYGVKALRLDKLEKSKKS
ncbi:MAG: MscL family protein [Patescibacteria group bacterium]